MRMRRGVMGREFAESTMRSYDGKAAAGTCVRADATACGTLWHVSKATAFRMLSFHA